MKTRNVIVVLCLMLHFGETHGEIPVSREEIEKRDAIETHMAELYETFGDKVFPEIYKALEENIEDKLY